MHLSPILSRLKGVANRLQKISWKSPKTIGGLSLTLILTGGLTFYFSTTTPAAAVVINGQQIGLVSSINAGEDLVASTLQQHGQPFGLVAKTHDQITYEKIRVKEDVYLTSCLNENIMKEKLTFYLDGYKLQANGSLIAILPCKEDADKILKQYQDYYVKPSAENNVTTVSFAEQVSIEESEVQPDQITQVDQAFNTLINGKIRTKDYTVQQDDSWWLIARKNNMLTDEVLAGNPGTTQDTKLQPGQIIKLVDTEPYLTVVCEGTYSGTETIPYDVVTKVDNNLGYGQTKIVEHGSHGSKLVTYSYMQKNGIDVSKQVLDEKIIQAPVNQVIAKGRSNRPVTVAYAVSRGSSGNSSIADRTLSLQGTPYVFGGTSTKGFDCSGFTKYVYSGSGISLPRTSYAQFSSGTAVSKSDLRPGDLVFFSTYAKGASHVGIYVGGGKFVHASTPGSGVKTSSLNDSFYSSRYLGARRYN
ncbi:MAG: NlpC/P60 family protein [Desulfosporosinus sp.]|jgi:cell wall-associated NlpC family hydrolase